MISGSERMVALQGRQRLFVYGTLLKGEEAEEQMRGAWFIGPMRTLGGYTLITRDVDYIGIVRRPQLPENFVVGELYDVTPDHLLRLDRYEDLRYERLIVGLQDWACAWAYCLVE